MNFQPYRRGFPKSQSQPTVYGEEPVDQLGSLAGWSGQGKDAEDPEGFLEHIICHLCDHPLFPDQGQEVRAFFMTSCGHIVCNDSDHHHKKGVCSVCGKGDNENPIAASLIDEHLSSDLKAWFRPPTTQLDSMEGFFAKIKFQMGEMDRKLRSQKVQIDSKNDIISKARDHMTGYKQLNERYQTLELQILDLQKENAELKKQFVFAQDQQAYPEPRQEYQEPLLPQMRVASTPIHDQRTTYPAPFNHIRQTDLYSHEPLPNSTQMVNSQIGPQDEDESSSSLNKRPRIVLPQRGLQPFSTPMHVGTPQGQRGLQPQPRGSARHLNSGNWFGRPSPAPNDPRNQETQAVQVNQPIRPSSSFGPRTNLEQFRFDPGQHGNSTPQPTQNRPFALHRRPASVLPNGKHQRDGAGGNTVRQDASGPDTASRLMPPPSISRRPQI